MALYVLSRRLSARSTSTTVLSLRFASYSSSSFREERDTFGPIQVPSDKFVLLFASSSILHILFFFYWFIYLTNSELCYVYVLLDYGEHKLRDPCRTSILVAPVNACPNLSFAPLASWKNALLRFGSIDTYLPLFTSSICTYTAYA